MEKNIVSQQPQWLGLQAWSQLPFRLQGVKFLFEMKCWMVLSLFIVATLAESDSIVEILTKTSSAYGADKEGGIIAV